MISSVALSMSHTKASSVLYVALESSILYISHLADDFIQSNLQMKTMEAIKINKRAMICKCYDKSRLA